MGQTIVVSVLADTGKFSKAFQSLGSGLGKFALGATAAVTGLAIGAAKLAKGLIIAGEEGAVSDARLAQVTKSMGLFGKGTDAVTKRMGDYSDQMARATGVDDDLIKMTQAKLMTFKELGRTAGKTGGMFDRATKAAVDMAQAGFGSASGNAVQLGKALNDPIKGVTALTKSGITFTANEKAQIAAMVKHGQMGKAQGVIMSAIEKQVGGVAAATATMSARMKVSGDQMKEALGAKLLPLLDLFGNWFVAVLPKATAFLTPILDQFVGMTTAMAGANGGAASLVGQAIGLVRGFTPLGILFKAVVGILPQLSAAFGQVGGILASGLGAVLPAVTPILDSLATIVGTLIASLLPPLVAIFGSVMAAVVQLMPPIMDLVNVALAALTPILAAIIPLFGMVAELVAGLMPTVVALAQPIIALAGFLIAALAPALAVIIRVLVAVIGWVLKAVVWFAQLITGSEKAKAGTLAVWGKVLEFFAAIPGKVAGWFAGAASWLSSAGHNIVEGLWRGISNGYSWIVDKIKGWVHDVLDFIKNAFGIHSPSTKTDWMGRMLGKGLAGGLLSTRSMVASAWGTLTDSLAYPAFTAGAGGGAGVYVAKGAIVIQAGIGDKAAIGATVVECIDAYVREGGRR